MATMPGHWANWLHTASFFFGLVIFLAAIGIAVGYGFRQPRVGVYVCAAMFVLYSILFWTIPGWMFLHTVINWWLT